MRKIPEEMERMILGMREIIEILLACAGMIGAAAWLLNRTERPKDPKEDEEQMEYLREWSEKHGKDNRKE